MNPSELNPSPFCHPQARQQQEEEKRRKIMGEAAMALDLLPSSSTDAAPKPLPKSDAAANR